MINLTLRPFLRNQQNLKYSARRTRHRAILTWLFYSSGWWCIVGCHVYGRGGSWGWWCIVGCHVYCRGGSWGWLCIVGCDVYCRGGSWGWLCIVGCDVYSRGGSCVTRCSVCAVVVVNVACPSSCIVRAICLRGTVYWCISTDGDIVRVCVPATLGVVVNTADRTATLLWKECTIWEPHTKIKPKYSQTLFIRRH